MLILGLAACDDPGRDQLLPADTAIVELNTATTPTGIESFLYLRENIGAMLPSGFEVTLTGQQRGAATNVTFEVDASSTAIEGVHYMVSSNTATIPANASTATLPINILPDNIEAGEVLTVVVRLTSSDVDVSPLYNEATHSIQITCPSDLAGTYSYVSSGTSTDPCCPNRVDLTGTVTITVGVDDITYGISDYSMGLYDAWYGPAYNLAPGSTPGNIQDVCGTISLLTASEAYGNTLTGTGTIDATTGVISYVWSNGWGDEGTATLTPQ